MSKSINMKEFKDGLKDIIRRQLAAFELSERREWALVDEITSYMNKVAHEGKDVEIVRIKELERTLAIADEQIKIKDELLETLRVENANLRKVAEVAKTLIENWRDNRNA